MYNSVKSVVRKGDLWKWAAFVSCAAAVAVFTLVASKRMDLGGLTVEVNPASVLAAPDSTVYFDPATATENVDSQFSLDARIDPGTNEVTAIALNITFDPAVLRLDSMDNTGSPFSVTLAAPNINNGSGTATATYGVPAGSPPTPVTADSLIAALSFHTLSSATDSPVTFTASTQASAIGESGDVIATRTPAAVTVNTSVAPTITNISSDKANGSYTTGEVIDIDVTFSENVTSTGDVTVTLETGTTDRTCTFSVADASTGTCDYTVQAGDTTSDLNVSSVSGTIEDGSSNPMTDFTPATNLADNKDIVIDTTAPSLSEVNVVNTPTSDTTPNYTFSSTEAGTISYGGSCSSSDTSASAGNNTITFSSLGEGTYSNCTVTVTDAAGNASSSLAVTTFVVDTTAPSRSNGSPSGTLSNGTTSVTLSLDTDEDAICKYGTTSDVSYGSIAHTFSSTNDTSHSQSISGLSDGNSYTYYVRCEDDAGNSNQDDYSISFTVGSDTTPPTLSEVTAVSTPTNDTTPSYTFSSTESGTTSYGGSCSGSDTTASSGNNTISFNTLSEGTYSDCTITVTDAASNASSALSVTSFTIDTTDPVVAITAPTHGPSASAITDTTIQVTDSVGIAAAGVTVSGSSTASTSSLSCSQTSSTQVDCTISIDSTGDLVIAATDSAGNSATGTETGYTVTSDLVAPVLAEVTAVSTPTTDTTPSYTFSSTEAGTISYGGSCSSSDTSASAGNNTITFSELSEGIYSNCTITVTDAASNASSALSVTSFEVDLDVGETTSITEAMLDSVDDTDIKVMQEDNGESQKLKKRWKNYYVRSKNVKFSSEVTKEFAGGEVEIYYKLEGDRGDKHTQHADIRGDGYWKEKVKFENDGVYTVRFTFYDSEGEKVDDRKHRVKVDDTAPEFINLPDRLVKHPGDKVWWEAKDNYTIDEYRYYWEGKKRKTSKPYFHIPQNAAPGTYPVEIRVYDKAGNKAVKTVQITVR